MRVGTVFLRLVGIEPVGADKLADELVSGMAFEVFVAWYERFLPLGAFHNPYREVELGQQVGWASVFASLSCGGVGTFGYLERPFAVQLVVLVGIKVEVEMTFKSQAVLVVWGHGPVGIFARKWW